jgi:uncharacterized membrane-anchored protein
MPEGRAMSPIEDHPLRYALANELHARPFPAMTAPSHVLYLAVKQPENAVGRDRAADRAHLLALLDRFGAAHPPPGATHHSTEIGRHGLKWESHTEFVTYTAFTRGLAERPFDPTKFEIYPADWLAQAPGKRMTSVLVRVEPMPADVSAIAPLLAEWFVPESLACSSVADGAAIVAGDFRIDSAGHMRFAVFARPDAEPRRLGRIVQSLCEIETYKSMSMLGLARVRRMGARMGELDGELTALVGAMTGEGRSAEAMLPELLRISSELERMLVESSFRFGATRAYEAIVHDRIAGLREGRLEARQTFHEFMIRRFDPAMRTVKSGEERLQRMAERAMRASDLLRTRVDVERSAQNQKLLASMDRRADLQLRLQRTVEGFSIVAISYYAVSLLAYLAYPVAGVLGMSKEMLTAAIAPVVLAGVWLAIRQIRKGLE